MDFRFQPIRPFKRNGFLSVTGTIVDMAPMRAGSLRAGDCMIFTTVEDMDGNTVNFIISPNTYVVDFETLAVGTKCIFYYSADAPAPLIYPPQYNAAVVASEVPGRMVDVSFYNASLLNQDQSLQLNIDGAVEIRTTNNQFFQGNPANHNLVVIYSASTRSIPARTTPRTVVVLCDRQM